MLVFRGLTSLRAGEDAVREVGTACRGRKSANSFLEAVLFAPDPEEQVGRKNGRNAVFLPGARRGLGVRLSVCLSVAEGVGCRVLGVRHGEEIGAGLWKALSAGESKRVS